MSDAASIWSAIAASFSALAAFTIMRIQHRNLLASSKPELVIEDWSRTTRVIGDNSYDVLSFKKISNAGKGPAFHVYINVNEHEMTNGASPTASMSTTLATIIPPDKEVSLNTEIILYWQNAEHFGNKQKIIPIEIKMHHWCSNDYRHETIYKLMAFELEDSFSTDKNEVAPKVSLHQRYTVSHAVLKLKSFRYLSQLPKIGKYFVIK